MFNKKVKISSAPERIPIVEPPSCPFLDWDSILASAAKEDWGRTFATRLSQLPSASSNSRPKLPSSPQATYLYEILNTSIVKC